jgi:hypothetical protein
LAVGGTPGPSVDSDSVQKLLQKSGLGPHLVNKNVISRAGLRDHFRSPSGAVWSSCLRRPGHHDWGTKSKTGPAGSHLSRDVWMTARLSHICATAVAWWNKSGPPWRRGGSSTVSHVCLWKAALSVGRIALLRCPFRSPFFLAHTPGGAMRKQCLYYRGVIFDTKGGSGAFRVPREILHTSQAQHVGALAPVVGTSLCRCTCAFIDGAYPAAPGLVTAPIQ